MFDQHVFKTDKLRGFCNFVFKCESSECLLFLVSFLNYYSNLTVVQFLVLMGKQKQKVSVVFGILGNQGWKGVDLECEMKEVVCVTEVSYGE